jgi:predicted dehydrogenase
MTRPVGYGVIAAGSSIARRAVIPAIQAAEGSELVATASRSLGSGRYEDVLADPDVEVVYVPLPNAQHREWTERAAAAGKHVLCEKPLAPTAADAAAMAAACERAGVILAEAWMTPFGPRWQAMLASARSGALGEVREVRGEFTFTLGPDRATDHRWDADGGGALLDVGIYTLGAAVQLWGADPDAVEAVSERTDRGVDVWTEYVVAWPGGRRAVGRVSFADPECQLVEVVGADGSVFHDDKPFTTDPDADPYRRMVEAMSAAVRGTTPWPRPASESVQMVALLERVAAAARPAGGTAT